LLFTRKLYLIKFLSYHSYICFVQVPQNLLIEFELLSENELVSFTLQIVKSALVQCSVVESSLSCYEITFVFVASKELKIQGS